MPWNWPGNPRQSTKVGGDVGTVGEASQVASWPNYDAAYLATRLGGRTPLDANKDRYAYGLAGGWPYIEDDVARGVYLDKLTDDFRVEADECLKGEFIDWLQGTHQDNEEMATYENGAGKMERRALQPTSSGGGVAQTGERIEGWKPTWWGQNQLTHLDGVREFLREKSIRREEHEFALNTLAEYGPQNIDQAWTYFKHWVKGRPVAPEKCVQRSTDWDAVTRSGPMQMAQPREPDAVPTEDRMEEYVYEAHDTPMSSRDIPSHLTGEPAGTPSGTPTIGFGRRIADSRRITPQSTPKVTWVHGSSSESEPSPSPPPVDWGSDRSFINEAKGELRGARIT